MSIKAALNNILEGNLDEMRQNFSSALTTKAVEKLEERKIEIAQNYFGQMQEEVEQIDEVSPEFVGRAANKATDLSQFYGDNGHYIKSRAYDAQAKRLWSKAAEKREKKSTEDQINTMSSGKLTKLKGNDRKAAKKVLGKKRK